MDTDGGRDDDIYIYEAEPEHLVTDPNCPKDDAALTLVAQERDKVNRNAVLRRLMYLTIRISEEYGSSSNLKRELRTAADERISNITRNLLAGVNAEEANAEDVESLIIAWPSKLGDVIFPVAGSRRFSGEIIDRIERLRDEGQGLINRWCDGDPLNLTHIEQEEGGLTWSTKNSRRQKRKKATKEDSSCDDSLAIIQGPSQKRTRELSMDWPEIETNVSQAPPPANEEEPMPVTGPTSDLPTEAKEQDRLAGGNPTATAIPPRPVTDTILGNKARDTRVPRYLVIIRAENRAYEELIVGLKRRIRTDDICVKSIRKTRLSEDAIAEIIGEQDCHKLITRLMEEGLEAQVMGERKKRIIIQRIEATATAQDIEDAANDISGTKAAEVMFMRPTAYGTTIACVQLPEGAALKLLTAGSLRIGWCLAAVREYREDNRCFSCGDTDHLARNCKRPSRVCFKCKEPGHIERDCCLQDMRSVSTLELQSPPTRDARKEGTSTEKTSPGANRAIVEANISETQLIQKGTKKYRTIATQTPQDWKGPTQRQTHLPPQAQLHTNQQQQQHQQQQHPLHTISYADALGAKAPATSQPVIPKPKAKDGADTAKGTPAERTEKTSISPQAYPKKKGVAIMISVNGEEFSQTLGRVKANTPPPADGSLIGIRRSRNGSLLIEMTGEPQARNMIVNLREHLGEEATIRLLGDREIIKIRGMDALVEKDDIMAAISSEIPNAADDMEQTEVLRLFSYPWKEKAAIIKSTRRMIEALIQMQSIVIGWTRAKIIANPPKVTRCQLCDRYGHTADVCRGRGGSGAKAPPKEANMQGTGRIAADKQADNPDTHEHERETAEVEVQDIAPVGNSTRNESTPPAQESDYDVDGEN